MEGSSETLSSLWKTWCLLSEGTYAIKGKGEMKH